jgi:hypothetical protein
MTEVLDLRDRGAVARDLREGLRSLAHLTEALDEREPTPADVTALDASLRGVGRLLVELRADFARTN